MKLNLHSRLVLGRKHFREVAEVTIDGRKRRSNG